MEGIFLVDKPQGLTSHDVVDIVRRRLNIKRVGHAGTLDPLATGLLIILVGRATKLFSRFSGLDKEYNATLKLGEATTTGDSQGVVTKSSASDKVSLGDLKSAVSQFRGEIFQVPPAVSALRHKGRRLYELARKGKRVNIAPRRITIRKFEIKDIYFPYIDFYVHCSKGTYIRKLAQDLGDVLGCFAHITKIRRISIGLFKVDDAILIEEINEGNLRAVSEVI